MCRQPHSYLSIVQPRQLYIWHTELDESGQERLNEDHRLHSPHSGAEVTYEAVQRDDKVNLSWAANPIACQPHYEYQDEIPQEPSRESWLQNQGIQPQSSCSGSALNSPDLPAHQRLHQRASTQGPGENIRIRLPTRHRRELRKL